MWILSICVCVCVFVCAYVGCVWGDGVTPTSFFLRMLRITRKISTIMNWMGLSMVNAFYPYFFAFLRGGVWHAITKSLLAFSFMMLPVVLCVQGEHLSQLDMATGYGNIKCLHCASPMGKLHTGIPGLLPTGRVGFIIHPYKVVQQMARSVILRLVHHL